MKIKKIVRLGLGFSILVSLVSLLWVCSIENIGLQEPSQIPIAEIVAELANANTQSDVAFAIDHLFDKTGVGRAIKGSRYNDYSFPDDFISDLAESHLRFLNDNDYSLSWGEAFEIEQALPDDDWLSDVDFQEVVSRFREQTTAALLNPEDPNNALLLAIAADGSTIPNPIPLYDEDELDILSSVQDLLFTVWVNYEFQDITGSLAKGKNITVKIDIQEVECPKGKLVTKEKFETPEFNSKNKALKKCHKDCKKDYKKAVKDCKKQFKENKKIMTQAAACAIFATCVDDLEAVVKACVQDCHDQGFGG